MRDAGHRNRRHRAGPWALLGAMGLIASLVTEGCRGGGNAVSSSSSGTTGDHGASSGGGVGGSSSSGAGAGPVALSITPAANAPIVFDATPDPQGTQIYFTAIGDSGAAVFSAPADGSMQQPTAPLAAGAPLVAPFGIAITPDGKELFVADPGADTPNDKGAIFALPVAGGTPVLVPGSEDMIPRGLEVTTETRGEFIYFTGTNKATGKRGVFKLVRGGGIVNVVLEGPPFNDPSGIAVAKNGDIYVADTVGAASRAASIIQIHDGAASDLGADLHVGYPTGVALTPDDQHLYVSALSPATLTDAIAIVGVVDHTTIFSSTGITKYREAGGMHRAKDAGVFAWVDGAGSLGGKVFVLR